MTTTAQLLRLAADILRRGWCQRSFALDALDKPCSALDRDAKSFDLEGALQRAADGKNTAAYYEALQLLQGRAAEAGYGSIEAFNDARERTREKVLALIEEALVAAESREAVAA